MIARRKNWLYRTLRMQLAQRIAFDKPVTAGYVKTYIAQHFKKIVVEVWPCD